jgi:hypothetical protein
VAMLSVGFDPPYLTGYEAIPSERLIMLLADRVSDHSLFVPQLDGPRLAPGPFDVVCWPETDHPVSFGAEEVGGARQIVVGDHVACFPGGTPGDVLGSL